MASQLTHFLEIDVSGLEVLNPRPGTFLVPGENPLDLRARPSIRRASVVRFD
jgi:hypothetical protein